MSELQQRSRSTILKCRAPCATARFPVANGQSPRLDPPTAAPPALSGAATPPSARDQPHVVPPNDATQNRANRVLWLPTRPSDRSKPQDRPPAAYSRPQTIVADVFPSNTSWLFEPTTGVHQFGGGSIGWRKKPAGTKKSSSANCRAYRQRVLKSSSRALRRRRLIFFLTLRRTGNPTATATTIFHRPGRPSP